MPWLDEPTFQRVREVVRDQEFWQGSDLLAALDAAAGVECPERAELAALRNVVAEAVESLTAAMDDDSSVGDYSWILVFDAALTPETTVDIFTDADRRLVAALRALVATQEAGE